MGFDSSALVAILRQEPDADRFAEALARSCSQQQPDDVSADSARMGVEDIVPLR